MAWGQFITRNGSNFIASGYNYNVKIPDIESEVIFYNNIAEDSMLDKLQFMSEVLNGSCRIKSPCSITNPVIVISSNTINIGNYCFIKHFNRYYYITDIISVNNDLIRVSLRVDVLMSFKDLILAQRGLISRNEFKYNSDLYDELVPLNYKPTIRHYFSNTIINLKDKKDDVYRYILTVFNNTPRTSSGYSSKLPVAGRTSGTTPGLSRSPTVTSYAMTHKNILNLVQDLQQLNDISQIFDNPSEGILSIIRLPFIIPSDWYNHISDPESIRIFSVTLEDAVGYPMYNSLINMVKCGSISVPILNNNFSFLNYNDSTYELFIPLVGYVELDPLLVSNKTVDVYYSVDIVTGKGLAILQTGDIFISSYECSVGVNCAISGSNVGEIARDFAVMGLQAAMGFSLSRTTTTTAVGGIAVNAYGSQTSNSLVPYGGPLARGNYGDLEGSTIPIYGNYEGIGINYRRPRIYPYLHSLHHNSNPSTGGNESLYLPNTLILRCTVPSVRRWAYLSSTNTYSYLYGRPLNEYRRIGELSGYTVVEDIHLSGFGNALVSERDEIVKLLTTGVRLP